MRGYHKVQVFRIKNGEEVDLPEGWKPFAGEIGFSDSKVLARKWERTGE